MNIFRLPSVLVLWAVIGVSTLSAQTPLLFENESAYAVAPKRASNLPATDLTAYRFHKKLPQLFTGFAIEVAASNFPLQRNNPVFRQFGNIHYEKLREGGYSYLILASFSSREAALNFLNEIILPKVPEARLFDYKDGIRKVIRE